jgi:hypothetical protein
MRNSLQSWLKILFWVSSNIENRLSQLENSHIYFGFHVNNSSNDWSGFQRDCILFISVFNLMAVRIFSQHSTLISRTSISRTSILRIYPYYIWVSTLNARGCVAIRLYMYIYVAKPFNIPQNAVQSIHIISTLESSFFLLYL